MKIFSEVPAEQAGTVIAIPAQDGQLVQAGAPLFILRKD
jgi:biotin carboxyl carrier protein